MIDNSSAADVQSVFAAPYFEKILRKHVIDVWFPRSLDLQHGGFLCDFDRRWKPCGPQTKLAEFQARHTLFAAEASRAFPDDQRLSEAALHGFEYLRETLWDHELGGWFHRLDRTGAPLEAGSKHVHGAGYAIQACVAVHTLTGNPNALDLALAGFEWLEDCAHDEQYGGYFGFLTRDGTVIRNPSDCPWSSVVDTIDTPIGCKDLNVHSDLLEVLVSLCLACEDGRVRQRVTELVDILCIKSVTRTGAQHFYCEADWTPVPHLVRFGYEIQSAFRLLEARKVIEDDEQLVSVARRLADHSLRFGWDEKRGGFFYASVGSLPNRLVGQSLAVSSKMWWIQVEALRMLLAMDQVAPTESDYGRYFASQWEYMQRFCIDQRYGGFYLYGQDVGRPWRRRWKSLVSVDHTRRKGDIWKDASHDGRALLYCCQHLT